MTALEALRDVERHAAATLVDAFPGMTVGPVLFAALVRDESFAIVATRGPDAEALAALDDLDRHALAARLDELARTIRPTTRED
jgi:hypothetical protein